MSRYILISLVLLCASFDVFAQCDQNVWSAPQSIVAAPAGNFTAVATLEVGSESVSRETSFFQGTANVTDGPIGDGFCIETYTQGEVIEYYFVGTLIDPSMSGSILLYVSVSTENSSWATLKSRFSPP